MGLHWKVPRGQVPHCAFLLDVHELTVTLGPHVRHSLQIPLPLMSLKVPEGQTVQFINASGCTLLPHGGVSCCPGGQSGHSFHPVIELCPPRIWYDDLVHVSLGLSLVWGMFQIVYRKQIMNVTKMIQINLRIFVRSRTDSSMASLIK